jgi:hypothetical protein
MKDIPGVSLIEPVEWKTGVGLVYKGKPIDGAYERMSSPTHGAIRVALDNGGVLMFWTSEWGELSYYAPKEDKPPAD